MKNLKVKYKAVLLMLAIIFLVTAFPVSADAEYEIAQQKTLGEIESTFKSYLQSNRPDIVYGTAGYAEYLTSVLIESSDQELSKLEDYSDILLYASEYLYQLDCAAILATDSTIFTLPASVKNLTPDQIRQQAAQKEQLVYSICRANAQKNNSTNSINGTFNATNAANYAIQYGGTANQNYFLYRSDCTNFVSQAWIAGGLSMRKPAYIPDWEYHTTDYWYTVVYYEPGAIAPSANSSTSFIAVDDFCTYMSSYESVTVTNVNSLSALQTTAVKGDVVQLKNGNGNYYHSIIISGGSSGDLTYSGHSNNHSSAKVSNITETNQFRIIHHN